MIFSSPPFFFFFAIYFLFHLAVPLRWRLVVIILGSTAFYGYWNPWYVWIPYLIMLIAFYGAHWVERARGAPTHFRRVAVVVCLLLIPLVVVKYARFIYQDVLGQAFGFEGRFPEWPLPLGISFVTFTMISYVVDVYRGHYPVETRLGSLTGLVLFFPHLIAGPILRPGDLLPQLNRPRPALRGLEIRIVFGLAIFSIGLLKKLVFADPLSEAVRAVFDGGSAGLSAADYLLAWYGFAVQIYCDFSGYTDMAIGIAMILGVRLPVNFLHPYTSGSIVEFWRRWHITLSTWLRDYLYIPIGGNRKGALRRFSNVMVTMGLGGLWHGANWTFILWGLWHGLGVTCTHMLNRSVSVQRSSELPRWLRVLVTFHFVTIGWILFRAPDLATAWRVFCGPFVEPLGNVSAFVSTHLFQLIVLMVFFITHSWDSHRRIRQIVRRLPVSIYWLSILLIWIISVTISDGSSAKFIYFDF